MANQLIDPGTISISQAKEDDLSAILGLFDEAVVWLNRRGIEEQWGTAPFSGRPAIRERFMDWIKQKIFFVARLNGRIVGSLVLNPVAPVYIADRWESFPASAFYLEAFVTARVLSGQGIGSILLQWAEQYTRASGRTTLWLDCWRKNPALVNYYQRAGFVLREEFMAEEWPGQLFEKTVG